MDLLIDFNDNAGRGPDDVTTHKRCILGDNKMKLVAIKNANTLAFALTTMEGKEIQTFWVSPHGNINKITERAVDITDIDSVKVDLWVGSTCFNTALVKFEIAQ